MFHGQELVLTNKNMSIISINKLEKSELNIVKYYNRRYLE